MSDDVTPEFETPEIPDAGDALESSPIRSALQRYGAELPDDLDDEAIITHLADNWERIQSAPDPEEYQHLKEHLPVLNDYLKHADDFKSYLESRSQEKSGPPSPEDPKWEPLVEDPSWDAVTEWDPELRRFVPRGKYGSAQAAEERNRFHQAQQERARRLASEPLGVLREAGLDNYLQDFRKQIEEELISRIRREESERTVRSQLDGWFSEHEGDLFVVKDGRVVEGRNGPVLTAKGRAYREAVERARSYGITDQLKIHQFAVEQLESFEPPEAPESQNERQKAKFMQRVDKKAQSRRSSRDTKTSTKVSDPEAGGDRWTQLIRESEEEIPVG